MNEVLKLIFYGGLLEITVDSIILERLEVGTDNMCLTSDSSYRPLINPPPSLGNLLLDITLCSISFRCRFLFFCYF